MLSARMRTLLQASAVQLRQGIPPLSHEFLVEHDVTLDEAYDLSEWLAAGVDSLIELDKTAAGQRLITVALATAMVARSTAEPKGEG